MTTMSPLIARATALHAKRQARPVTMGQRCPCVALRCDEADPIERICPERHTRDGRRSATELTPRSPRLLLLDQPRQTRLCSEPRQQGRCHRRADRRAGRRTVAGTGTRSRACQRDQTDGQTCRSQRHELPNNRPRDDERAIVPVGPAGDVDHTVVCSVDQMRYKLRNNKGSRELASDEIELDLGDSVAVPFDDPSEFASFASSTSVRSPPTAVSS